VRSTNDEHRLLRSRHFRCRNARAHRTGEPDLGVDLDAMAGNLAARLLARRWGAGANRLERRFRLRAGLWAKDVDLVYFDVTDISERRETHHAERLQERFAGLPVRIDVKNEARVHLWYAAKFGYSIPPYRSTAHAISTFPTTATSVGIQPKPTGLSISAPFGLSDLLGLIVRPNKVQITRSIYEAKVARWRALCPRVAIIDWSEA